LGDCVAVPAFSLALDINKFIILVGTTSETGWESGRMKNKRYIALFVGAIIWMFIVWIPFYQRHSIALFLTAIYCSVAACLAFLFVAVDTGARRRKLEEQKTEERNKKIASAIQRAQTDAQNKLETQKYIEANRRWKLEKAQKLETSRRYEAAARMYDALEMPKKAGECRRMTKTSS
jgi:hypothetical protein